MLYRLTPGLFGGSILPLFLFAPAVVGIPFFDNPFGRQATLDPPEIECLLLDESAARTSPMDELRIRQALESALQQQGIGSAETRRDIAFHMTDWLSDLVAWNAYCQSPEDLDADETVELLNRFLIHVPNHLAAASKLMTGIPVSDIFEVGAVDSHID